MPPRETTTTIDRTTKVNLGLLLTMVTATIGCAAYLANLNGNVVALSETMREVKIALERNTAQISLDGQDRAVQRTILTSIERRVDSLERQFAELMRK